MKEKNICECVECKRSFDCQTDIILCDNCQEKFDLDRLWKLHDENKLCALDFNESKSLRDDFRFDYCESCEEYINQIDLGDGTFGCPICKTDSNITTFYNEEGQDINNYTDNQDRENYTEVKE